MSGQAICRCWNLWVGGSISVPIPIHFGATFCFGTKDRKVGKKCRLRTATKRPRTGLPTWRKRFSSACASRQRGGGSRRRDHGIISRFRAGGKKVKLKSKCRQPPRCRPGLPLGKLSDLLEIYEQKSADCFWRLGWPSTQGNGLNSSRVN